MDFNITGDHTDYTDLTHCSLHFKVIIAHADPNLLAKVVHTHWVEQKANPNQPGHHLPPAPKAKDIYKHLPPTAKVKDIYHLPPTHKAKDPDQLPPTAKAKDIYHHLPPTPKAKAKPKVKAAAAQ